MMMMPDKKNSAATIVAKMKPSNSEEVKEFPQDESVSDYSMAKEDAAKKILEAFESKDAKKLSLHLQDFMDMCEPSSEE